MVTVPILGDVIREIGGVVRELVPDADKRMDIQVRLAELADQADARETQLLQGQLEVNKEEARNSNVFVAGWRPAIGWVCATALGWTWVAAPLLQWGASLNGVQTTIPALDPNAMFPIVLAMLGVSASRTYEKVQGVATSMGGRILKNEQLTQVQSQSVQPGKAEPPTLLPRVKSRWFP